MNPLDPGKWFSYAVDMIRAEVFNYVMVALGIVLIVFLGFALPIAGEYLANERVKAEQGQ